MLLGFINGAVEYLENHMNDENDQINDLKNADLYALRNELASSLDVILGTKQSTLSALMQAGNEAFYSYIDPNDNSLNLSERFDRALDSSYHKPKSNYNNYNVNNNNINNSTNNHNDLAKMLSTYNLEGYDRKKDTNDDYMNQIRNNALRNQNGNNHNEYPALDSVFNEIVNNENQGKQNNSNFASLIDELRKQMIKEDELAKQNQKLNKIEDKVETKVETYDSNKTIDTTDKEMVAKSDTKNGGNVNSLIDNYINEKENEEKFNKKLLLKKKKQICDKVSKMYMHLPLDFIENVYDLKEEIAQANPVDKKVIVLHRIKFNHVENLRQFVEIGLKHGYTINADEDKLIVDIFKQFVNTDGKILNNIYEIANQGYHLEGEYEGYNVIEVIDRKGA